MNNKEIIPYFIMKEKGIGQNSNYLCKIISPILKKEKSVEFINDYAEYYYIFEAEYNRGKKKDEKCPKYLRQSSYWVDAEIMKIKDKENDWDTKDVVRILAWKTGNINHEQSKSEKKIIYLNEEWDEEECSIKLRNGNKQNIKKFAEKVVDIRKKYSDSSPENKFGFSDASIDAWKSLVNENDVNGLGTVYLITILFFVTKGKCPIYDRFAMGALLSFENTDKEFKVFPRAIINIKLLPGKLKNQDGKIIENKQLLLLLEQENIYTYYFGLLRKYFENWSEREVDMALWVYGHFFEVNQ